MRTDSIDMNAGRQIREATSEELIAVEGGLSFEMKIYGYELWIGEGGIGGCGPESCFLAMWSQLGKGM